MAAVVLAPTPVARSPSRPVRPDRAAAAAATPAAATPRTAFPPTPTPSFRWRAGAGGHHAVVDG